ncbi:MAG: PhnA domain-containing protein [Cellulophaga sp.]|uniref:PhnA domain-containing protein n=1 Tax=unclassified Cellulophaga TaxID=2634405 RepID=UPI000C2C12E2|nr:MULTISPECIES: alkylphosphonate utilization protein [unclassified Cellulophaga]MDO6491492.1 PhnA domain-containing protein [Cellulophaga sp. 2_MG-2023]MDO6493369.1 PhnA domain-containing protein [Cellulophaga sp. 3_MG-2023]PKB44642.1 phosphonoacetate hydrolase [Cellulophaga sp. RHA19]
MSIERELSKRSQNKCELCSNEENLKAYQVSPTKNGDLQDTIFACNTCITQIEDPEQTDPNHWRCLNDSMWSEQIPVQIIAWRMLNRLRKEGWPQDLLDMMYLDDDNLEWAKATGEGEDPEDKIIHRDSNGVIINAGDSVVLIKDLPVKGSSMVAKRGTAVRRVSLDHENAEYIEGKVDGQQIVIITKYVKKI